VTCSIFKFASLNAASAAWRTPRAAASIPIREGFDAAPRPLPKIFPPSSISTQSVFVPPPSNPIPIRIPKA
jgi:hypothetical protein